MRFYTFSCLLLLLFFLAVGASVRVACVCVWVFRFVFLLNIFKRKIARQLKVRQTKTNVEIFNKQNLGKIDNNNNTVSTSTAIKSKALSVLHKLFNFNKRIHLCALIFSTLIFLLISFPMTVHKENWENEQIKKKAVPKIKYKNWKKIGKKYTNMHMTVLKEKNK